MDREAWHAVLHWVAKSRTWLSGWTELNWTEYPVVGLTVSYKGSAFCNKPDSPLVSEKGTIFISQMKKLKHTFTKKPV